MCWKRIKNRICGAILQRFKCHHHTSLTYHQCIISIQFDRSASSNKLTAVFAIDLKFFVHSGKKSISTMAQHFLNYRIQWKQRLEIRQFSSGHWPSRGNQNEPNKVETIIAAFLNQRPSQRTTNFVTFEFNHELRAKGGLYPLPILSAVSEISWRVSKSSDYMITCDIFHASRINLPVELI